MAATKKASARARSTGAGVSVRPTPKDHLPPAGGGDDLYEPFPFQGKDGVTYYLDAPTSGPIRKARKLVDQPLDLMFTMLEDVAGPAELEALDQLLIPELADLFGRWMDHMGTAPGK